MLTDVPFWLLAILTGLVVLIPLIFLFLLGVRLLAQIELLQTLSLLILLGPCGSDHIAAMGVVGVLGNLKNTALRSRIARHRNAPPCSAPRHPSVDPRPKNAVL